MFISDDEVRGVLANEAWYSENTITWPGAPTYQSAKSLAEKRSKQLKRRPRNRLAPDFWSQVVGNCLLYCSERNRCCLGGCPQCGAAVQRWLTYNIVQLAAQEPHGSVHAVSIASPYPLRKRLTSEVLGLPMAHAAVLAEVSGQVEWAVFCLDLSWNDYNAVSGSWPKSAAKSGWQPHVYGFVKATSIGAFKDAAKELLEPVRHTPLPIKVRPYDGSAYGASYAFKTEFQRRVSYFDKSGTQNACDYRLPVALSNEAIGQLSKLGHSNRIGLIGLEITKTFKIKREGVIAPNKTIH